MNRRGFIGAIAAAFVADPERLLWTPGAKLISIPKPVLTLRATVFFFDASGSMWMKTPQGTVKLIRQPRQIAVDTETCRYSDTWIVPDNPQFRDEPEPVDAIYKWEPRNMAHVEPGDKLINMRLVASDRLSSSLLQVPFDEVYDQIRARLPV